MSASCIHFWWMGLLALVAGLLAFPEATRAQDHFAPGSACFAETDKTTQYGAISGDPERWTCADVIPDPAAERTIVRRDLRDRPADAGAATVLSFSRFAFTRLHVAMVSDEKVTAQRTYTLDDISIGERGWVGRIVLPETLEEPTAIVVTIDGTDFSESVLWADITAEPETKPLANAEQILVAMLCGILLAPIFFDLGFHRTLRESFPLYHALFCLMAFLQTFIISGLAAMLLRLPLEHEWLLADISFELLLIAAAVFIHSFLEKECLDEQHRRLLRWLVLVPVAIMIAYQFGYSFLPENAILAFIYSMYGVFLGGLYFVLFTALRKGSRAARYLTVAFTPLLALGVFWVVSMAVVGLSFDFDDFWIVNFALFFEVAVTAFAVADRFLSLKRERDSALREARSLESLSERDALTGLLNRRALEARFAALRAQGFTALAIVDLDHFKRVNDTYGHNVGDDVLKSAAHALMPREDQDLLAFRIGGEEFLLLLRGRSMQIRAEERRKAVTKAIAEETDIAMPVTASMGYLEATTGALADACFDTLYERADRLLYEAKENGRNRMMVEKVKVFQRRAQDRREERQAA